MVEKSVGRKISTPADFAFLSGIIAERCKETLGITTLKRIWGYIEGYDSTRNSTLSILARSVGFHDWDDFLNNYESNVESSHLILGQTFSVNQLRIGDSILVTWAPDRRCTFYHCGEGQFRVTSAENSKLRVGDTFHCPYFIIGQPSYLDNFVRDNKPPTLFVIGKKGGISECHIL